MRPVPAARDYDGWVSHLAHNSCRQRAKAYLWEVGAPAVPAITRGLKHPKATVRRTCASLLDRLMDPPSIAALVFAVDDPDPKVRGRALHALACDLCKQGESRPSEDAWVPKAIAMLGEPDPDVRAAAIDALGKVAGRRADARAALRQQAECDSDTRLRSMARRRSP